MSVKLYEHKCDISCMCKTLTKGLRKAVFIKSTQLFQPEMAFQNKNKKDMKRLFNKKKWAKTDIIITSTKLNATRNMNNDRK